MKNAQYVLTGLILSGVLVASVLLVKKNQHLAVVKVSSGDSKSKGSAQAPIQMVEYSDFQCPACARAETSIEKIMSDPDFKDKIHFVYRHFPLSGHRWSGLAHQAAECANEQGKFWGYHKKLYGEQAIWSVLDNPTENFIRYAKDSDLSIESFGFCLANPEIHQKIMREKKKGEDLQIQSTPTFFVNGERLVGPVELEIKGPEMIRKILGLPPKPETVKASPSPSSSPESSASPAIPAAVASPAPALSVSASPSS